jgi:hypothetical protein
VTSFKGSRSGAADDVTMRWHRAALMPLGAARGPEALNVWEHIALAEWLDGHEMSGDGARALLEAELFETEASYYEALEAEAAAAPSSDSEPEEGGASDEDEEAAF